MDPARCGKRKKVPFNWRLALWPGYDKHLLPEDLIPTGSDRYLQLKIEPSSHQESTSSKKIPLVTRSLWWPFWQGRISFNWWLALWLGSGKHIPQERKLLKKSLRNFRLTPSSDCWWLDPDLKIPLAKGGNEALIWIWEICSPCLESKLTLMSEKNIYPELCYHC